MKHIKSINESNQSIKVALLIGDEGGDGHGKYGRYDIMSNLTTREMNTAYVEGCKLINYDGGKGIKSFCQEYEDTKIPKDFAQKLEDAFYGSTPDNPFIEDDLERSFGGDDTNYYIDSDTYVDIYLRTVKLGNPSFEYSYTSSGASLDIGGYGLFY